MKSGKFGRLEMQAATSHAHQIAQWMEEASRLLASADTPREQQQALTGWVRRVLSAARVFPEGESSIRVELVRAVAETVMERRHDIVGDETEKHADAARDAFGRFYGACPEMLRRLHVDEGDPVALEKQSELPAAMIDALRGWATGRRKWASMLHLMDTMNLRVAETTLKEYWSAARKHWASLRGRDVFPTR